VCFYMHVCLRFFGNVCGSLGIWFPCGGVLQFGIVDGYETGQVLMVKAPVLEPIDPGSILAGGFLEGHDFTIRHGRFGGRPP
jgi:hypothetical protein